MPLLLVLENSSASHYNDACKPVSVCELLRIENNGRTIDPDRRGREDLVGWWWWWQAGSRGRGLACASTRKNGEERACWLVPCARERDTSQHESRGPAWTARCALSNHPSRHPSLPHRSLPLYKNARARLDQVAAGEYSEGPEHLPHQPRHRRLACPSESRIQVTHIRVTELSHGYPSQGIHSRKSESLNQVRDIRVAGTYQRQSLLLARLHMAPPPSLSFRSDAPSPCPLS